MNYPKLYIGPMSKNVVDAAIEYAEEKDSFLGLIPSRRQVDFLGGYVNKWDTKTFSEYVKSQTSKVLLVRDHGGPLQGAEKDPGFDSFFSDCFLMDVIHIDPWKQNSFERAKYLTELYIKFCFGMNSNIEFEIGTEQAIHEYEADQLEDLILHLKGRLSVKQFDAIKFAVIQSGTSLKDGVNTGKYSESRLSDMLAVTNSFGLLSKEHNGDYLESELIQDKFAQGLDAINIAPEFGQIETQCLVEAIGSEEKDQLYYMCLESEKWKKWTDDVDNKDLIIKTAGHYLFATDKFQAVFGATAAAQSNTVKAKMKDRIHSIVGEE